MPTSRRTPLPLRSEFCHSLEICFTQGSQACQTSAIDALQSLCDPCLSLRHAASRGGDLPLSGDPSYSYLADSLPTRETLAEIMTVLLNPFTCELRTNFSIQLLTMRTFVLLASRGGDYSFTVVAECLAAKNRTLVSFLRKLAADFKAANAACRSCVDTTFAFLHQLVELPSLSSSLTDDDVDNNSAGASDPQAPRRTLCLTAAELAWVLNWPVGATAAVTGAGDTNAEQAERRRTHPLTLLQGRLAEAVSEEHQPENSKEDSETRHELLQLQVSCFYFFLTDPEVVVVIIIIFLE